MTRILLLLALMGSGLAQQPITLTSTNIPQNGTTYYEKGTNSATGLPGASGADVSWDFSAKSLLLFTETFDIKDPANTPYAAQFPTANQCYTVNGDTYIYYTLSADSLVAVGNMLGTTYQPYSNGRRAFVFPHTYGTNYVDTYTTGYLSGQDSIQRNATVTVTTDAWGTLKTPFVEVSGAIRIRSETVTIDSTFTNGNFVSAATSTSIAYIWWHTDHPFPMARVFTNGSGQVTGARFAYQQLNSRYESRKSAFIWNTTSQKLTLSQQLQKDRQLTIHDLSGRTVYTQNLTAGTAVVQMSYDLSPGIYVLQVEGLGAQKGFVFDH